MPRQRAKERESDEAIKKTLAYSSIFNYPLSQYQLYYFLNNNKPIEKDFLDKSLKRLLKNKQVRVKSNKYYLSGIKPVSWELRDKYSKELIEKNKKELNILSKIPWIKMIGITGSVAANNAEKDVDTDILVVAGKNRVWITRGFLSVLLVLLRKYPNRESENLKICPNIYLTEDNLTWPKEKQNIYTAREVIMLQPFFDKNNTYFRFIKENDWALKYFPNVMIETPKRFKNNQGNLIVDFLEKIALNMQISYMKNITTENLKRNFIHFSKHDKSRQILKDFSNFTKKAKLSK